MTVSVTLLSILWTWSRSAPARLDCDCHCIVPVQDPPQAVLDLLGRQLERCGPEHLTQSCPPFPVVPFLVVAGGSFISWCDCGIDLLVDQVPYTGFEDNRATWSGLTGATPSVERRCSAKISVA